MNRFDELIMKPLLIYKYEKSMQKKSKDFFKIFMTQGEEIEKDFVTSKRIDVHADDLFAEAHEPRTTRAA